jgi:tetratricopeptide (TPR) repeat protein
MNLSLLCSHRPYASLGRWVFLRRSAGLLAGVSLGVSTVASLPLHGDEPAVVTAPADAAGQEDLDAAVDAKLGARSLDDFEKVLGLVRSALRKGLDESSRSFANDLYTGTLVDRASMLTEAVFAGGAGAQQQWERMRAYALRDLGEVVQRDDALAAAQVLIARLEALPGGDRQRALAAARRAVEIGGDDPLQSAQAHVVIGNLSEDDPEARRGSYDKAVDLSPRDVDVRRTRGLYLMMEGDQDGAVADFDVAIEEDPDDTRIREMRGLALLMAQRTDDALKNFDDALELAPDSADLLFQRGRVFASMGNTERAMADLDRAIAAVPEAAEPRVLRARLHQQAGNSAGALEDIERVLSRDPDHPSALELRGLIAADSNDYPAAIADFRRLVRQNPGDAVVVGQLGFLYLAAKEPREAIRRFSRALEIDPEQFLARRGRGDAAISIGDHAAAIADLEKALELQPDNDTVLNNLAWVLATSPDDAVRDGKRAIELAQKACELTEWKQPHVISTLAAAHAESGDFDEARKYSRQAVEGSDEAAEVRVQLKNELESYEAGKPWRERQSMEEGKATDAAATPAVEPDPKAPAPRARPGARRPFDED